MDGFFVAKLVKTGRFEEKKVQDKEDEDDDGEEVEKSVDDTPGDAEVAFDEEEDRAIIERMFLLCFLFWKFSF
jgi:23S rRNA maturation-related 3'-5' exoribonuclease YhaM